MKTILTRMAILFNLLLMLTFISVAGYAGAKGIYLTQYTLENTAFLNYLIKNAKAAGINTFIVDMELPSKRYRENIALVKQNGIQYVARIIMFPGGGTPAQIADQRYWARKYALAQQAIDWGASQIQLDYIRFKASNKPSPENSKKILAIIQWFKTKLVSQNIPLQIDVFGIAAFGESKYIGQNIKLFAPSIDAVCPMVYPSHYTPFAYHFKHPYDTILDSLERVQGQFGDTMPIKLIPYIELSNYHYSMPHDATLKYIQAQLDAVEEADADGWYAWSPHNRYDNLFKVLISQNDSKDNKEGAKPIENTKPAAEATAENKSEPVTEPIADNKSSWHWRWF